MSVFEKKDPGKFTVRFNMADPQQKAVIDLLNQQGRYKAQFLTNAVLHYVRRSEAPDIKRAPAIDSGEIERIVFSPRPTASPDPRTHTESPGGREGSQTMGGWFNARNWRPVRGCR